MEAKFEREFPFEFHQIEDDLQKELIKDFKAARSGFVRVGNEKWFLPKKYAHEAKRLYNFQVRCDDVWIVTFPRSGTTWTQEMVWLIANDLDYATALRENLPNRFPFFEYYIINHQEVVEEFLEENANSQTNQAIIKQICEDHLEQLETTKQRRLIKTHLPFSLLPPNLLASGCKVIYVARNPKDVAVSYYHLSKLARNIDYVGSFEKFWDYFMRDSILWAPYWQHIHEGWSQRHNKNLCFLFYEDLNEVKNLRKTILRVANFLEKPLTETEVDRLENHLKFENFKNNKCVNSHLEVELGIFRRAEEGYVRKGMRGGWKEYFTEKMIKKANEWIEVNEKLIGIHFRA